MSRVVYIALPAFGQVNFSRTTSSLMALGKALLGSGYDWYFNTHSFPDIAEARNLQTSIFMDRTEADWMLQVDADMGFEPQLVLDMLALGEPVVGCLYPAKTLPIQFVGELLDGDAEVRDCFMQVKDVGGGVLLVHRAAIEMMLARGVAKSDERLARHTARAMLNEIGVSRIIRAFDPIETESGELSEDKSFCRRHRECGGDIWAAIDHPVTHIGLHGYTAAFGARFKREGWPPCADNGTPAVTRATVPAAGASS